MASETPGSSATRGRSGRGPPDWLRGLPSGLAGGLGMVVLLTMTAPSVVHQTMPAVVGLTGGFVGSTIIVGLCGMAGVVFSVLVDTQPLRVALATRVAIGVGYGLGLWGVASVVVPVWLGLLGTETLPLPWFDPTVLAGLLVYGIVLAIGDWVLGEQ